MVPIWKPGAAMHADPLKHDRLSFDVVVIGSGPGGAVSGTVLAEAGKSVLMIEEGAHRALNSAPAFSYEEILQKYRNAGVNLAMGKAMIAYVEGQCVGGGSEINRGLYHRAPDWLLERWRRDHAVADLTPESLAPHFAACEGTAMVEYLPGDASLMSRRLHDGAVNLGWKATAAPRLYRYGEGGGRKQSMSETFVPRFLSAGGQLLADTRVRHIARHGGKWRVHAVRSATGLAPGPVEITADRVFVACGAVHTPALLRRSGMRGHMGNSLRLHPMVKVVALFDDEVNQEGDLDPVHQVREFEPELGMGCSISKRPTLALALADRPDALGAVAANWRRMGIYYAQGASGRATVRNLPGFRDPLVRVNQGPDELRKLAKGLRLLCEALFAAGARLLYPCVPGYPVLHSPADLDRLPEVLVAQSSTLTSVHVFASCPMGEDPALSATNSFGRVWGSDGLHIADASLLCGPTTVNPQGTVMAIAHRNAVHAVERGFR